VWCPTMHIGPIELRSCVVSMMRSDFCMVSSDTSASVHRWSIRPDKHDADIKMRANFAFKLMRPGFGPPLKRLGRTVPARRHAGRSLFPPALVSAVGAPRCRSHAGPGRTA
jgi:hypothetical protein